MSIKRLQEAGANYRVDLCGAGLQLSPEDRCALMESRAPETRAVILHLSTPGMRYEPNGMRETEVEVGLLVRSSPLLTYFVLAASCGGEPGAQYSSFTVVDSAGTEIVQNSGPGSGVTRGWEVSSRPIVTLGVRDEEGPEQFTRIGGVVRLSDGVIVVLETGSAELRFFGSDGTHLRTVGGFGGGPGELRLPRGLARLPGDTLAVWDLRGRSLEYYSPAGDYLGSQRLNPRERNRDVNWTAGCSSRLPLLPNGSILRCVQEPGVTRPARETPEEGLHRSFGVRLVAASRTDQGLDTMGVYLGDEYYLLELGGGVITDGRHPFLSQTFLATSNEPPRFLSATNPEYSIEVWTLDGKLERVVRRLNARRTPTEVEEAAAWDLALENVSSDLHGRVRSLISEGGLLPAIHGLATGPSGEIWTKRDPSLAMTGKAMYDVFDPLGRYLGGVTLPRDVDIQSVGDDYVLATRHDQFDVPYIEVFSLLRR